MAEYNNNCVEKIQQKIRKITNKDAFVTTVSKFLKTNNLDLTKCFDGWNLPNWFDKTDLINTLWG